MKNFFKKLSFVLAIAMVLTTIAPATASAAEVVPAKKVNVKLDGEKVTSVELDVEETKTVKVGLVVKKAYAGQKSTYKTWYTVADENVVDVVREGNKTYTLTGVAAGETTITINAAKTLKLAKAGKGVKSAPLTVVVNAPAVELTATQTGAKEITIAGLNGEAKDGMAVTLKKGNNSANVTSVKAEDENTLVITTTAKIQTTDYTVVIGENEVTFTGEAEKLTTLDVSSDIAVANVAPITDATYATVPYVALNQWEEAMTVTLTATSSLGTAEPVNGIVKITFPAGTVQMEGQLASVVLVCAEAGMSDSATVAVSAASKIKTASVDSIYCANPLATFVEGNANAFYLLINAEDQYGNAVNSAAMANSDLLFVSSNPLVATTAAVFVDLSVGGVNKIALQITPITAGTSNIIITPKFYGGSTTYAANVAMSSKVDTITFTQNDSAYVGENLILDVEAYDVDGNLITDLTKFNAVDVNVNGTNGTVGFKKNYVTGKITYDAGVVSANAYVVTVVATTPTWKTSNIMVYTQAKAIPTVIGGLVSTKTLAALAGETVDLSLTDFVIYDQYDRVMTRTQVAEAFGTTYDIKAVTTSAIAALGTVTGDFVDVTNSITLDIATGLTATASKSVTLQLTKTVDGETTVVTGSDYTAVFSGVKKADLVDYVVYPQTTSIYAPASAGSIAHTKYVAVMGKTASGLVVSMPVETWDVVNTSSAEFTYSEYADEDVLLVSGNNGVVWYNTTNPAETKDVVFYINIVHDGKVLTQTLTACEAAPVLTTIEADTYNYADEVFAVEENAFMVYDVVANVRNVADLLDYLDIEDQYSVAFTNYNPIIVVSNLSYGLTVTSNGSSAPVVNNLTPGATYTATISLGGKTITIDVVAK